MFGNAYNAEKPLTGLERAKLERSQGANDLPDESEPPPITFVDNAEAVLPVETHVSDDHYTHDLIDPAPATAALPAMDAPPPQIVQPEPVKQAVSQPPAPQPERPAATRPFASVAPKPSAKSPSPEGAHLFAGRGITLKADIANCDTLRVEGLVEGTAAAAASACTGRAPKLLASGSRPSARIVGLRPATAPSLPVRPSTPPSPGAPRQDAPAGWR